MPDSSSSETKVAKHQGSTCHRSDPSSSYRPKKLSDSGLRVLSLHPIPLVPNREAPAIPGTLQFGSEDSTTIEDFFTQQTLCANILAVMNGEAVAENADFFTHNRAGVVILNNVKATVNNTVVVGNNNDLEGENNLVIGDNNVLRGNNNRARGSRNKLFGRDCVNHDTGELGVARGGFTIRNSPVRYLTPRTQAELHQLLAERYSAGSTSSCDDDDETISPPVAPVPSLLRSTSDGISTVKKQVSSLSNSDFLSKQKPRQRRRRRKVKK